MLTACQRRLSTSTCWFRNDAITEFVGAETNITGDLMSMFPHIARFSPMAFGPSRCNHCQRFVFFVIIKIMRCLFALVVLFCLAVLPEVRAESQDEQYVRIY